MGRTIYASFVDRDAAEKAAGALLDHGTRAEDISLVQACDQDTWDARARSDYGSDVPATAVVDVVEFQQPVDDYASTPGTGSVNRVTTDFDSDDVNRGTTTDADMNVSRSNVDDDQNCDPSLQAKEGISTTTPADAGAGAAKGAVVGVGVGVLAALAALFVPGIGLVVGGGALAAALGGVAATTGAGAVAGALTGYLKDQGVDEEVAHVYGSAISGGGAVLAVTVPSGDVDETEAESVLVKYGATNINAYGTAVAA